MDEIARREKFVDDALRLLGEREAQHAKAGDALDAALRGDDVAAVRVALDTLDTKPNHIELFRERIKAVSRASSMREPRDVFLREHEQARTVLKTACELRLSEARATLERVIIEEQSRLNSLGEGYEASNSPVVRRAKAYVAQLEGMLNTIQTANAESFQAVFVNFSQQLLTHE